MPATAGDVRTLALDAGVTLENQEKKECQQLREFWARWRQFWR